MGYPETDPHRGGCLVCRQLRGAAEVPGGLVDAGLVVIFHRPPSEETLPYAGHLLVCPRRHAADFAALTSEEAAAVGAAISVGSRSLKDLGAARVYVATVGHHVDHLHVHLLPRWPETPDEVPWHAVDDWNAARRATPAEIEELIAGLRP